MKKQKNLRLFHALFKKLWDKRTKKVFLFIFNYLKTETRKNSEKIHSDSRKYYANFRYIIKVRTQKLCEI